MVARGRKSMRSLPLGRRNLRVLRRFATMTAAMTLALPSMLALSPVATADELPNTSSPLAALLYEAGMQSASTTARVDVSTNGIYTATTGEQGFFNTWRLTMSNGTIWTVASVAGYPDRTTVIQPETALLVFNPTTDQVSVATWADGVMTPRSTAAGGPDVSGGDLLCGAVASIIFGPLGALPGILRILGLAAAGAGGTAICALSPLHGLVWYGNGLEVDTSTGVLGDVFVVEDLRIKPQSCIQSTSIVPCQAVSDGQLKNVTVSLLHNVTWPDGFQERFYRSCAYTSCAPPFRYRNCSAGISTVGNYRQTVYQDEAVPGGPLGYMPSGSVNRTYVVS